jgi:hypothetical protein
MPEFHLDSSHHLIEIEEICLSKFLDGRKWQVEFHQDILHQHQLSEQFFYTFVRRNS